MFFLNSFHTVFLSRILSFAPCVGTSPRPKTKGEESKPDRIEDDLPPPREDLPKRVIGPPKGYLPVGSVEVGKTGRKVVMVVGWR